MDADGTVDEQATAELDAERQRHREVIDRLTAGDNIAFVAEANRHLDRVHETMRRLAQRRAPVP